MNQCLCVCTHHLMCTQKYLEECEGLEGRLRRNYLRTYPVPEKAEGNNMIEFIENLIHEELNIREEIYTERAHRAATTDVSTGRSANFTRSIIVSFRSFKEKKDVLYTVWSLKDIRIKDQWIYFDEDYTTEVFKERIEYGSARKQLQERKIKSCELYTAKLILFLQDKRLRLFKILDKTVEGLKDFGVKMEVPRKEFDWTCVLQAGGGQSPVVVPKMLRKLQPTLNLFDSPWRVTKIRQRQIRYVGNTLW